MDICRSCLGCNLIENKNFKGKDKCEYYVYDNYMDHFTLNSNYINSNKSATNIKNNKALNR